MRRPVSNWEMAVMVVLYAAVLGTLALVLQPVFKFVHTYVFEPAVSSLGLSWVPPSGGYFVVESSSPLAGVASLPFIDVLWLAAVFLGTVWLIQLYRESEDTAGLCPPLPVPVLGVELDDLDEDEGE